MQPSSTEGLATTRTHAANCDNSARPADQIASTTNIQRHQDASRSTTPPNATDAAGATSLPVPFTPFKIVRRGNKAREADASPASKSLIKHMNTLFRVSLAVNNPWPNDTETTNELKIAFRAACNDVGADRRLLRYEKDSVYAQYIGDVVRLSILVITDADGLRRVSNAALKCGAR